MALLNTKKAKAHGRVTEKIGAGKQILLSIKPENAQEFEKNVDGYERWRSSVERMLTQLFSDDSVCKNYVVTHSVFIPNTDLEKDPQLPIFQQKLTDELTTLEDIANDIKTNVYPYNSRSQSFWQTVAITIIGTISGALVGYINRGGRHCGK